MRILCKRILRKGKYNLLRMLCMLGKFLFDFEKRLSHRCILIAKDKVVDALASLVAQHPYWELELLARVRVLGVSLASIWPDDIEILQLNNQPESHSSYHKGCYS